VEADRRSFGGFYRFAVADGDRTNGFQVTNPSTVTATMGAAGNLRGIAAMVAANAVLSANDACLKLAASELPMGQLVFIRNGFGTLLAVAVIFAIGAGSRLPNLPPRLMLARTVTDVCGALLFIAALVRMPFADAIAIGQCLPLAITAGAAIFLAEPVGWRRWAATSVGFIGVLLIIKPGSEAFTPASLLAVGSVLAIAARDLVTRRIPSTISALLLATLSMGSVMLASLAFAVFEDWRMPTARETLLLAAAGAGLFAGYVLLIFAIRTGEVSAVVPFRYTLIIWAILGGWLLWGELPDGLTVIGTAIVVAAGLYTLHREQMRRRRVSEI